ncbi:hypothetical protein [Oerskovia jenensis]|uniref:hypothetical protein n=1 Tax=Oerskovia jenensis TaxID=162169 RepID=UPI0036DB78E5
MTRPRTRTTPRRLTVAALGVTATVGLVLLLPPAGSTSALWRAADTAPVPALHTGSLVVDLDVLDAPVDATFPAPEDLAPAPDAPAPADPTAELGSATGVPSEDAETAGAPAPAPATLDALDLFTGPPAGALSPTPSAPTTHETRTP